MADDPCVVWCEGRDEALGKAGCGLEDVEADMVANQEEIRGFDAVCGDDQKWVHKSVLLFNQAAFG